MIDVILPINTPFPLSIFPIHYFPPVPWFAAAMQEQEILLEVCQHYRKQQYTNRIRIRAANSVLPLIIPLDRKGSKTPIAQKIISYREEWQKQHWKSLESAYRASPYFVYYEDTLATFYDASHTSLLDFHLKALDWILAILDHQVPVRLTESYLPPDAYAVDYRDSFDPAGKMLPPWFRPLPYPQVFEGFSPGLSILDLVFNEGPAAALRLKEMVVQPDGLPA